jgi:hypothetical protein
LASAERSLSLSCHIERGNNKYTVADRIKHINHLQIPSRLCLAETYPRAISSGELLSGPTPHLAHLRLGDAMFENMRQIGFRVDPEA